MLLVKNASVYSPEFLGIKDILIAEEKIVKIDDKIDLRGIDYKVFDAQGKIVTPGLIDQHVHITGGGGGNGFNSKTPEVFLSDLTSCGTTTVVGVLGTDGVTKSIEELYSKTMALTLDGISAYMYTGYYGVEPLTITSSVINDMVCIDKVVGCKLAISDVRADYPTTLEVLRLLKQVRVGGMISGKSGILHVHLGALETRMAMLIDIVQIHQFPIKHISPTHVGRTEDLFAQAIEFAKLGGIIDISSGGTKFTDPYKQVMIALEAGVSINNITMSSDGNGGVSKLDDKGNVIGFRRAPFHLNLEEVRKLILISGMDISDAIRILTTNPARNLSLKNKGSISIGSDADFCFFDDDFVLTDVIARGVEMMIDGEIVRKSSFE